MGTVKTPYNIDNIDKPSIILILHPLSDAEMYTIRSTYRCYYTESSFTGIAIGHGFVLHDSRPSDNQRMLCKQIKMKLGPSQADKLCFPFAG